MMREPESMDECVYFTNRTVESGRVKAWVFKEKCPKCGKGLMSKPRDEKTGKVKIRAKEYVCPECGYKVGKKEYEETLTINIKYVCPKCKHEGEKQQPFKRKKYKGVDAIIFECENCGEKIPILKKFKNPKK